MAEISGTELQTFNASFADAISQGDATMGAPPLDSAINPKKLFCENWDTVSGVLSAIADLVLNIFVKGAIKVVIAAGNALKKAICP